MKPIYISVVIPAYNESLRIGSTLERVMDYFNNRPSQVSFEVLVVDDGSKDGTCAVVETYSRMHPEIRLIQNEKNCGKGYSVNNGMNKAIGKYKLFMDADNSVDISHIDAFIDQIEKGADVVIGSIRIKESQVQEHSGWYRRGLGYLSKLLISVCAVPGISDTQRGFKLFSASAADAIFPLQTINRFGFDIEILVIAWVNGLTIKELPVVWNNADGSTVTWKSYFQTLRELAYIMRNRIAGKYSFVDITLDKVNI